LTESYLANKMKKKIVKKEEETFAFVKLYDSLEVRKELLKIALDDTKLLRDYEAYKNITKQKEEMIKAFSERMTEINGLVNELRKENFPYVKKVEEELKKEEEIKRIRNKGMKVKVIKEDVEKPLKITRKPSTQEDKLDVELRDLQNRLNRLGI